MAFTYDLYVHERGRWILESSFGFDHRRDAIALAKRIEENRSADGIQLIRERFDPKTGRTERSTVYNTWRRRKARAWRRERGEAPGPYAGILAEQSPRTESPDPELLPEPVYPDADTPARPPPAGSVLAKLIAIAVASFGLASLVTVVHGAASAGAAGF